MTWFKALTFREKSLVLALLPIAAIFAGYQFAWLPLSAQQAAYNNQIASYRLVTQTALLADKTADQTMATPSSSQNDIPLANRITQSSDVAGIVLRRIETDGAGIRVTLADTSFSELTFWLANLEQVSGITVAAIEIDRRPEPGTVSAQILLEDL
jgi:general secretion pathway protein M